MSDKNELKLSKILLKEVTGITECDGKEAPTEEEMAKLAMSASFKNSIAVKDFLSNQISNIDYTELLKEVNRQSREIAKDESMELCQQLLASQAIALDTVFNSLTHRAASQEYLKQYETYMKLALRAQAQSRCALEAISKIKNPPNATFVKQANIAQGHQQVNNGVIPQEQGSPSREAKIENQPNELLEEDNGERLDFRAKTAPSKTHKTMEAVGKVNGTSNHRR